MPKSVLEIFKDHRTRAQRYINEQSLEEMADLICQKAHEPEIVTILQIIIYFGVYEREYYRIVQKYKVLTEAHDYAMTVLAAKRELGAIRDGLNVNMTRYSMPMYSEKWKEVAEFYAQLSKQSQEGSQQIVVQMQPIPSSDLVPPKETE